MMQKIDPAKIEAIKNSVDLIAVAEDYTTLKKKTRHERCGACPRCGGRDRFFVNAEYWGCRGCHEKPGDAIDLVRWMDNCDFITALEKLSGESLRNADDDDGTTEGRRFVRDKGTKCKQRSTVWATDRWQKRAHAIIEDTAAALDTDAGTPGRAYLEARGIEPYTWCVWLLGYSSRSGGAITIPYMHSRRMYTCFAIRYRRLAAPTPEDRYSNESDSYCLLHGLHLIDQNAHTLVVVEGELNAVSIWQASRDLGISVVSIGSQYLMKDTLKALAELSKFFPRCMVWCDDPDRALRVHGAVASKHVLPLQSPKLNDAKIDANDMLQRGLLRAFVDRKLEHFDTRRAA